MKNNNYKGNNDIVLRINKEKVVNWFFTGILIIAGLLFILLLVRGVVKSFDTVKSELSDDIDTSLLSAYYDSYLDVYYPVPGDSWGMADDAEIASNLQSIVNASKGSDGYFDIMSEPLSEEVLSSMWLEAVENRQYLTVAFKPNLTYGSEDANEFILYSTEALKFDIEDSSMELESTESYKYDMYYVEEDDDGDVLMKVKLTNTYRDEETGELKDIDMYIIRYSKSLGCNAVDMTYGCINEDDTVVPYLKYILNNMVCNLSLYTSVNSDVALGYDISSSTSESVFGEAEEVDETNSQILEEDGIINNSEEDNGSIDDIGLEIENENVSIDGTEPHIEEEN